MNAPSDVARTAIPDFETYEDCYLYWIDQMPTSSMAIVESIARAYWRNACGEPA